MPIDLKSLKKLEPTLPSLQAAPPDDSGRLLMLVKLNKGAKRPSYLTPRAEIGPELFSVEIEADELERLEADPAIESVSISRALPSVR